AVCIPPGARLSLQDLPERLQREFDVGPNEEVTFTQLTAQPSELTYEDAMSTVKAVCEHRPARQAAA
ncbi:MAG TPA: hypothetical protein VFY40_07010, partial [Blastocatellia bacterium]|nr:hypothetical protein [Blastocatellia bacterium]